MVAHHLRIFVRKVVVTIQVPMDTLTMLLAQGVDVYMGFAKVDFALTVRVEVNCRAHTMLVREVDVNIPAAFLENVHMIVVKEVCACMVTAQALAAMQHVTEVAASTHGALMASATTITTTT